MQTQLLDHQTGAWTCCCWEERFDDLANIPLQNGQPSPGVLMLEPPFLEISTAQGLWETLNARLGTIFDFAEDEDLSLDQLPTALEVVSAFASKAEKLGDMTIRVEAGEQLSPTRIQWIASLPAEKLAQQYRLLKSFFDDSRRRGKSLIISL